MALVRVNIKSLYLLLGGFFIAKNSIEKQRQYDLKCAGLRTRNWAVVFIHMIYLKIG